MDLRNVKDLEGKTRICDTLYKIGLVGAVASPFAAYITIHSVSLGWGVFLCCLGVVMALVAGTAQVTGSYLHAEDMYRISGRRPEKKRRGTRK